MLPGLQYLSRFIEELRKRGTPEKAIDLYRNHWSSLPARLPAVPCPFCFAAGHKGSMTPRAEVAGLSVMRCDKCDVPVVVRAT